MATEAAWLSLGTAFGFLALFNSIVPPELRPPLRRWFAALISFFSRHIYYTVHEFHGPSNNELYSSVEAYLNDAAARNASNISLSTAKNASSLTFALEESHDVVPDKSFRVAAGGAVFSAEWRFSKEPRQTPTLSWRDVPQDEKRCLHLRVHKKQREHVNGYLTHVMEKARELKRARKERQLYTNRQREGGYSWGRDTAWDSVPLKHPATFDTLAMDPSLKADIIEDLREFSRSADFYRRAGRAWKRGYLLYGPPGTGKSSMIAAIANLLQYDIYDLELTEVKTNLALKSLLLKTGDRAVIVIEDIDCSLDLTSERASARKRRKARQHSQQGAESRSGGAGKGELKESESQVTLSGLLNFIDGLWSSCGNERIFVFTTNHIEKLDPALIRSGRMDRHIHLSYCCFHAFKVLAKNYLQIEDHALFDDIQRAIADEGAQMTPAEVSEVLTREKRDVERALTCVIEELRGSKEKRAAEEKLRRQQEEEEEKEEEEAAAANNNKEAEA